MIDSIMGATPEKPLFRMIIENLFQLWNIFARLVVRDQENVTGKIIDDAIGYCNCTIPNVH